MTVDLESGPPLATIVVPTTAGPAATTTDVKSALVQRLEFVKSFLGVSTLAAFCKGLKKELPALAKVQDYSKPKTSDEVKQRFQANTRFFKFTYTSVCVLVTAMFVLSSPVLLIFGMLLALLWMWVLGKSNEVSAVAAAAEPGAATTATTTVVGGREIGHRERVLGASVATVLYVVLGGVISTVVYILVSNALIIGAHASMREPVMLDELEAMEQETDAIIQGA